ncbi:hypothetical protein [Nostoc sp.]|uniref:hypothetical protein n=1 Tax=Nostoc sp. TaxID=1180 RepID=UPI002FF6F6EC
MSVSVTQHLNNVGLPSEKQATFLKRHLLLLRGDATQTTGNSPLGSGVTLLRRYRFALTTGTAKTATPSP